MYGIQESQFHFLEEVFVFFGLIQAHNQKDKPVLLSGNVVDKLYLYVLNRNHRHIFHIP